MKNKTKWRVVLYTVFTELVILGTFLQGCVSVELERWGCGVGNRNDRSK